MPIPQAADFYYLKNFQTVLDWVSGRYSDLLSTQEVSFAEQFRTLPQSAQALLVRMVMRKGSHFRLSKLAYDEIGCTETAAQPLIDLGWLSTE
ncbi:MAG: VRR-NUC domain-containing protein, partial [Pseudomonas neustonica]